MLSSGFIPAQTPSRTGCTGFSPRSPIRTRTSKGSGTRWNCSSPSRLHVNGPTDPCDPGREPRVTGEEAASSDESLHPPRRPRDRRQLRGGRGRGQPPRPRRRSAARRGPGRGDPPSPGVRVRRGRPVPRRHRDLPCPPGPLGPRRPGAPRRARLSGRGHEPHPGRGRLLDLRPGGRAGRLPRPPPSADDRSLPGHALPQRPQRLRRLLPTGRVRRQAAVLLRRHPGPRSQGRHLRGAPCASLRPTWTCS